MPLYEYQCDVCGGRFEVIQKFADAPIEVCRSCGGRVQRLLSAPAIQFKGSGWYITDYARKNGSSEKTGDTAKPAADQEGTKSSKADATASTAGGTSSGTASSPSASTDTAKTAAG